MFHKEDKIIVRNNNVAYVYRYILFWIFLIEVVTQIKGEIYEDEIERIKGSNIIFEMNIGFTKATLGIIYQFRGDKNESLGK